MVCYEDQIIVVVLQHINAWFENSNILILPKLTLPYAIYVDSKSKTKLRRKNVRSCFGHRLGLVQIHFLAKLLSGLIFLIAWWQMIVFSKPVIKFPFCFHFHTIFFEIRSQSTIDYDSHLFSLKTDLTTFMEKQNETLTCNNCLIV